METHVVLPRSRSLQDAAVAVACVLMALTVAAAEPHEARSCYLRAGDRVVFYGDSITEQAHYTRPIETFVQTRCHDLNVAFINSGWGGDRAWGGEGGALEERLQRDVVAHRPTVVTVMLGMNDGYYTSFDPTAVTAFKESLEKLIDTLTKALPGVRITLIGTSPYDNVTPGEQPEWETGIEGGYDSVVSRFSAATREVAAKHGLLFVDMHEPLVQLLQQLQTTEPKRARELIPDRIHPGPAAGLVMAARLLNAWHVPASGGTINIDASNAMKSGPMRFQQVLSLPVPFDRNDQVTRLVRQHSPDMKQFADDTLCVTGLPLSKAFLVIDGNKLGPFTAEQFDHGINFSELDSSIARQATAIGRLVDLRGQAQFTRWRTIELPFAKDAPSSIKDAANRLEEIEKQLADSATAIARPQSHTIEIFATEQ